MIKEMKEEIQEVDREIENKNLKTIVVNIEVGNFQDKIKGIVNDVYNFQIFQLYRFE